MATPTNAPNCCFVTRYGHAHVVARAPLLRAEVPPAAFGAFASLICRTNARYIPQSLVMWFGATQRSGPLPRCMEPPTAPHYPLPPSPPPQFLPGPLATLPSLPPLPSRHVTSSFTAPRRHLRPSRSCSALDSTYCSQPIVTASPRRGPYWKKSRST